MAGFEYLSEALDFNDKVTLKDLTVKYNELGADFQDGWSEEYWKIYELVRGGYKKVRLKQYENSKTNNEITTQVSELQEIAITMNRPSTSPDNKEITSDALKEIDEIAKEYDRSTLIVQNSEGNEQTKKKCCSACVVF